MQTFKLGIIVILVAAFGCGRDNDSQLSSVDVGTESKLVAGSCKVEFEANSPKRMRRWSIHVRDSLSITNAWGQRMEPRKKSKKGDRITQENANSVRFDFKTAKPGDGYGVLVPYDGVVTIDVDLWNRKGTKKIATKTIEMPAKDLPNSDFVLDEVEFDWSMIKKQRRVKKLKRTASLRIYAACDKYAEPEATTPVEEDAPDAPECVAPYPGQDVLGPKNCGYLGLN